MKFHPYPLMSDAGKLSPQLYPPPNALHSAGVGERHTRKRRRWRAGALMATLLIGAATGRAWGQSLTVPLGGAAQFGVLSGATLTADSASAVRTYGRAGAATAIVGPVQSTAEGTTPSLVSAALADLSAARAYCAGLSATALTAFSGHTLSGGVYAVSGPAAPVTGTALVLTGDTASRFVIRVSGNLTLGAGARVVLTGSVQPRHVTWCVSGSLTSTDAALPGVVLVGGAASLSGAWSAASAVLAGGNLSLAAVRFGADAGAEFFAAGALRARRCGAPMPSVPPVCANWVSNGSFELTNLVPPVPTTLQNVCNGLPTTTDELRRWRSANYGTPDWFRRGGAGAVGVPNNFFNSLQWLGGLTPTGPHTGDGYAGVHVCHDATNAAGVPVSEYREYLQHELATPLTAQHYYVEFRSLLAANSSHATPRLGIATYRDDPYQSDFEHLRAAPSGMPAALTRHDLNFNSSTVWSRSAGVFRATGGEAHVVIGNFDDNSPGNYLPTGQPTSNTALVGYQYVDDVLVQEFPQPADSCYFLTVRCPLPASAGALYRWTITYADSSVVQSAFSSSPAYTAAYPPVPVRYVLTIRVPYPDQSGFFPDVTYPARPFRLFTPGFFVSAADLQITGNVVWNTNKRVRGTLYIHPGATLTITSGAVIQFDDTRRLAPDLANRTRVVVAAGRVRADGTLETDGGKLIVEQNAVLTVLYQRDICDPLPEARMWDGVVLGGRPTRTQPKPTLPGRNGQGMAVFQSGARVEHARYGARAGHVTYTTAPPGPTLYPGLVVKQVAGNGGGILIGENATFRDCYKSTSFTLYDLPNRSGFWHCTFEGTQVLRDPDFYPDWGSAPPVRVGMQYGADLQTVRGITFVGNTFRGYRLPAANVRYRGNGISAMDATFTVKCDNFNATTRTCDGGPNHFSQLSVGISSTGSYKGGEVVVLGNVFTDNERGIDLSAAHTSKVQYNRFECGTANVPDCHGLFLGNTYDVYPAGNVFTHTPTMTYSTTLVGMMIRNCSQTLGSNDYPLQVRSNTFGGNLASALYFRDNNTNVTFRCNEFNGPFVIADVELRGLGGIKTLQGECDPTKPYTTANNRFSPSCTPVQPASATQAHIAMQDGSARRTWFRYYYPDPLIDPRMKPTCVQPYGPVQVAGSNPPVFVPGGMDVQPCGIIIDSADACPPIQLLARSTDDIKADLAATPDHAKRQGLVSELMHLYLTDTAATALDSAVALLQREDDPAYAHKRWQLEARLYESPDASDAAGRAGRPRKRSAQPMWAGASAQAAHRGAAPLDYGRRVVQLLFPYGSDSLRVEAFATDAALRATFVAMAEDSLAWGCMAARTALNLYAGTHYPPIGDGDGETGDGPAAARHGATAPGVQSAHPAATLLLLPNPSTGHVRVGYGLPQAATTVELRVFNQWGQPQGTYTLTDEALTAGVWLRLRAGIYHCQLVADGAVVAKERLLIATER